MEVIPNLKTKKPVKCSFMISGMLMCNGAPVLVALALIESGMKYEDAVEFIRRYPVFRRRGAINSKQLTYLEQYKPSKLLKEKGPANNCCVQ
ncbi:Protein tyrosine phosphatase type IVA 3 [Acropora cervicornis]|uniref:Protein tyrosine phosphatase type IVA 3 n=1 Tax=Acropora cervicornis TaxID=6130 RepID=A0AAD9QF83_ACRCE|nr:Protein tyrosine phosphatase type IVA 3 [Acropora cervicornis]